MENKSYDSKNDTLKHIKMVQEYMRFVCYKLNWMALNHDKSKLEEPEKRIFDEFTPKLKETTYGSDEYKSYLNQMQKGLRHHYENNNHHPEHYENGIKDMTLFDLFEMFIDWEAATKRHNDGDIHKSIKINKDRFGYDNLLESIFENTATYLDHGFEEARKLFNENDSFETKEIVYRWLLGGQFTDLEDETTKNAYDVIMTLISMGMG